MDDTIAGISTALGIGAISIIRLSGRDSFKIVNSLFKGKDLTKLKSHRITHGYIINNNEIIDEVLISVMKAPNTYTKEDIVEINCHGGIATTNKVLELLISHGSRLATPGEFTKRAFLNGRIDLSQAEGIMNLIEANTETSRSLSINQLQGEVSNEIRNLRQKLISIISNIEVNIDYPEYEDIEVITNDILLPELINIASSLETIIKKAENGKIVSTGIKVGIIGRPNVGKSSLLNTLLQEEKAIVTDIAGTTRDLVEGELNIDGIIFTFIDTAGIRKTEDIVESIGVKRSLEVLENCELVILILNNNEALNEEDLQLLNLLKDKKKIILINKIDLEGILDKRKLNNYIEISIKNNLGIDKLKEEIKKLFHLEELKTTDMTYLISARSLGLLRSALEKINNAINITKEIKEIDIIEIDLKGCWEILGEIIGETYTEELLDQLFSRFCLGK